MRYFAFKAKLLYLELWIFFKHFSYIVTFYSVHLLYCVFSVLFNFLHFLPLGGYLKTTQRYQMKENIICEFIIIIGNQNYLLCKTIPQKTKLNRSKIFLLDT